MGHNLAKSEDVAICGPISECILWMQGKRQAERKERRIKGKGMQGRQRDEEMH